MNSLKARVDEFRPLLKAPQEKSGALSTHLFPLATAKQRQSPRSLEHELQIFFATLYIDFVQHYTVKLESNLDGSICISNGSNGLPGIHF